MVPLTVVIDACVFYSAPLRDVFLELSADGVFRARWSAEIHEEWIENLLKKRPDIPRERLERLRELIDAAVPDCLVTGHQRLVPRLTLPDADDRHVLAAAIAAKADAIVTLNTRDFPKAALGRFGMEAVHPDDFLLGRLNAEEEVFCGAIRRLRGRLKHPPMTVGEYLKSLGRQPLPKTVEGLGRRRDLL